MAYRQAEWKMVWVRHPWMSVRFDADRLLFSEPHESDMPNARWARGSPWAGRRGRGGSGPYDTVTAKE